MPRIRANAVTRRKDGAERTEAMAHPVVHFEIIGGEPAGLRDYYGQLFGWEFDVGDAATEDVSEPGAYGFVDGATTGGINGGIGGGPGHRPKALFYVAVEDVEAALRKAESLGGKRLMGPEPKSGGEFRVGRFADPEGNVIGVAGPA
jgi:predicted enzyme related to lactoylglutathione lyase